MTSKPVDARLRFPKPVTDLLSALERGELAAVCAVDILNEGVDVPSVDRVVMLRPGDERFADHAVSRTDLESLSLAVCSGTARI